MESPDPYSTHIPVLATLVSELMSRDRDVELVEFGCGFYSTPMLAGMLQHRFHSFETDKAWAVRVAEQCGVPVQTIDNYGEAIDWMGSLNGTLIAFIDSGGDIPRRELTARIIREGACDYIVQHDAGWLRRMSKGFTDPKELREWPMEVYMPVKPATAVWTRPGVVSIPLHIAKPEWWREMQASGS